MPGVFNIFKVLRKLSYLEDRWRRISKGLKIFVTLKMSTLPPRALIPLVAITAIKVALLLLPPPTVEV